LRPAAAVGILSWSTGASISHVSPIPVRVAAIPVPDGDTDVAQDPANGLHVAAIPGGVAAIPVDVAGIPASLIEKQGLGGNWLFMSLRFPPTTRDSRDLLNILCL